MSHPPSLPPLSLELHDGQLDRDEMRALFEIRVQRRLSMPTQCEISLLDPPLSLEERVLYAVGGTLRVGLSDGEALFDGEVTAVEHEYGADSRHVIRVRGYDLMHRLRQRQPVRAHIALTLEELATELVADLGISVEFAEAGPPWRKLIQFDKTDLELLTDLAERCGIYFSLQGNTLHGYTLSGAGDPVALNLGSTLLEARIEINVDSACDSVAVTAWDPSRVESRTGTAELPRSGSSVLPETKMPDPINGLQRTLSDVTVAGEAHAALLAQGELDRRAARQVMLSGVAEGHPQLWPGTVVEIGGVVGKLEGTYVVTSVNHRLDRRMGFVTEFSTTPPPPRNRGRGAIITWATVSRIDDPDRLGRICAALPSYSQVETDWMGVVAPGAGAGKGLLSLPDIGDHVLVVFPNENLEHGVVVGGLFGAQAPPDQAGIEKGKVRRFTLVTPGGQRVLLDDSRKSVRVENSAGSYVELLPGLVRLHAATDLSLEAPGQTIFIRGRSIRFEKK